MPHKTTSLVTPESKEAILLWLGWRRWSEAKPASRFCMVCYPTWYLFVLAISIWSFVLWWDATQIHNGNIVRTKVTIGVNGATSAKDHFVGLPLSNAW